MLVKFHRKKSLSSVHTGIGVWEFVVYCSGEEMRGGQDTRYKDSARWARKAGSKLTVVMPHQFAS